METNTAIGTGTEHLADRYLRLAAELRAVAAECQAIGDAECIEIVGRASRERARVFRRAAQAADHAHWVTLSDS